MAKDTAIVTLPSAEEAVMDFLNEHENQGGNVHRAFSEVLSEKQQLKADNELLTRENAELAELVAQLEREVYQRQQGPGGAQQEVMVELMAQVNSLTTEIKLLRDQNKSTDDNEHQLPSKKDECNCDKAFLRLLEQYLYPKECLLNPNARHVEVAVPTCTLENQELLHEAGQAAKRRRSLSRSRSISSQRNSVHGMRQLKRANTFSIRSRKEQGNKPQLLHEAEGGTRLHHKTSIHKTFSAPPKLSGVPTVNNVMEVVAAGPVSHTSSRTSIVKDQSLC